MGIHDREYYRDESGHWWAAMSGHRATWGIIAVTVVVWLAQLFSAPAGPGGVGVGMDPILPATALTPEGIAGGELWRLVTCHFVHAPGDLLAVALGMLFLYWFGTGLEDLYGTREFLGFYLATGLLIAAGKVVGWGIGADPVRFYYGAAGVLSGVLVLFACHYPHRQVLVMFIIPMPVWLLAAILVGLSVIGLSGGARGPVPHLIAAGFAFVYFRTRIRLTDWMSRMGAVVAGRRRRANVRLYTEPRRVDEGPAGVAMQADPVTPAVRSTPLDEQLEAQLDRVLEKVAREGRSNLSAEEQAILMRASEVFKNRRDR